MTSSQTIIDELGDIENEIKLRMKIIEDAFDIMEAKVSNWKTKRCEILKAETKKALQVLSERDRVSFI